MGLPAYILTNLLTLGAISDQGTAASTTYPLSYLIDAILGTTARWTGGVAVEANLSDDYDSLFIGNHNIVSPEYFQIQATAATPPDGTTLTSTLTARTGDMFIDLAFALNRQYLRVAASLAAPVEVGELIVGTRVLFPRQREWSQTKPQTNLGISQETRGGNRFRYNFGKYTEFRPSWMFPESEYATFLAFSDAVDIDPFVWIPDVATTEAYFVDKEFGFNPQPVGPAWDNGVFQEHYRWQPIFRTRSKGLTVNS